MRKQYAVECSVQPAVSEWVVNGTSAHIRLFSARRWLHIKQDLANQDGSCRWEDRAFHNASARRPTSHESCAGPHHLTSHSSAGMNHAAPPSTDQSQTPSYTWKQHHNHLQLCTSKQHFCNTIIYIKHSWTTEVRRKEVSSFIIRQNGLVP